MDEKTYLVRNRESSRKIEDLGFLFKVRGVMSGEWPF